MSSPELTVILHIVTIEGQAKAFYDLWCSKVSEIRKQMGCKETFLYQDPKEPNKFIMVEKWDNYEAWQTFLQSELVAEITGKASEYTSKWELHKLYQSNI